MAKPLNQKTAKSCHAQPNDHAQRFAGAVSSVGGLVGGVSGFRAMAHFGVADGGDNRTAFPDDDPADHDVVSFLEISGGVSIRF